MKKTSDIVCPSSTNIAPLPWWLKKPAVLYTALKSIMAAMGTHVNPFIFSGYFTHIYLGDLKPSIFPWVVGVQGWNLQNHLFGNPEKHLNQNSMLGVQNVNFPGCNIIETYLSGKRISLIQGGIQPYQCLIIYQRKCSIFWGDKLNLLTRMHWNILTYL